jgi:CMP-N-acetylneuraminic acid synthetase
VVSTDCSYIKQVARAHGAAVFERPGSLADDNSPSELALLNVLNRWRPELLPDYVVFMQCTSPFTTVGDVFGTLDVVQKDGCGSALAVTKFHGFLWRASGESVMGNPARMRGPRQTNEQVYLESGSVYAFDRRLFMKEQTRFCGKTGLYISETPRFEIDTPEDLEQARKMVTEFYCD